MKKLLCVLLIALTLVPLAACGGEKDKVTAAADSADNQAPEASVSQKQPSDKKSESKPAASEPTQSTDGVDVDLTRLSSTMVYSEVYNMMNAPGDYIGKTTTLKRQLYKFTDRLFVLDYQYLFTAHRFIPVFECSWCDVLYARVQDKLCLRKCSWLNQPHAQDNAIP